MNFKKNIDTKIVIFSLIILLLLILLGFYLTIKKDKDKPLVVEKEPDTEVVEEPIEEVKDFDSIISLGLTNSGSAPNDYKFTFSITNGSENVDTLNFPTTSEYTYTIYNVATDRLVYDYKEEAKESKEPVTKTVKAKESLSYEVDLNEIVKDFADGNYKIQFKSTAKEAEGMSTSITFTIKTVEPLEEKGNEQVTLKGVAEDGNSFEGVIKDTEVVNIFYIDASVKSLITKDLLPGTVLNVDFEYIGDKRMVTKARILAKPTQPSSSE